MNVNDHMRESEKELKQALVDCIVSQKHITDALTSAFVSTGDAESTAALLEKGMWPLELTRSRMRCAAGAAERAADSHKSAREAFRQSIAGRGDNR